MTGRDLYTKLLDFMAQEKYKLELWDKAIQELMEKHGRAPQNMLDGQKKGKEAIEATEKLISEFPENMDEEIDWDKWKPIFDEMDSCSKS